MRTAGHVPNCSAKFVADPAASIAALFGDMDQHAMPADALGRIGYGLGCADFSVDQSKVTVLERDGLRRTLRKEAAVLAAITGNAD